MRTKFVLRRTALLTLVAACVLIPVAAAVLNGFLPGLGQHAAQTQPLAVPATPTALPTGGPGSGYRATAASETIFGHLGGAGLAVALGAIVILIVALRIRTLRRRRTAQH
ncbi:MAG TPA: hypothetical protein VL551_01105 [Actinospica sp.]|jgi:hypothetical protein|nr:hypothetical protein [Actinospica sp.]